MPRLLFLLPIFLFVGLNILPMVGRDYKSVPIFHAKHERSMDSTNTIARARSPPKVP